MQVESLSVESLSRGAAADFPVRRRRPLRGGYIRHPGGFYPIDWQAAGLVSLRPREEAGSVGPPTQPQPKIK
jgi:hypothetical protein